MIGKMAYHFIYGGTSSLHALRATLFKGIWNVLVPEIVLRLLEEQANTISKVKLNKIGFRVLVLKKFISKEEINIHKLI